MSSSRAPCWSKKAVGATLQQLRAAQSSARRRALSRRTRHATAADLPEEWDSPLEAAGTKQPVVALGKFDALHKGHRSLVAQAAELGGSPWLLSFEGMAEVLGWPPRPPLVAACDRERVLATWAPLCGGSVPRMRMLPFAAVRGMTAQEFVGFLATQLQVRGIVVGQGYRFGYKQTGDTGLLVELGGALGIEVVVSDLVGAGAPGVVGKVSSSEVRRALLLGKPKRVRDYLDRRHRLIADTAGYELQGSLRISRQSFHNQLPCEQLYSGDLILSTAAGEELTLAGATVDVGPDHVTIAHPGMAGESTGKRIAVELSAAVSGGHE